MCVALAACSVYVCCFHNRGDLVSNDVCANFGKSGGVGISPAQLALQQVVGAQQVGNAQVKRKQREAAASAAGHVPCWSPDHDSYADKLGKLLLVCTSSGLRGYTEVVYSRYPWLLPTFNCTGVPAREVKADMLSLKVGKLMCDMCWASYRTRLRHIADGGLLTGHGDLARHPLAVLGGVVEANGVLELVVTWRNGIGSLREALHVDNIKSFIVDVRGRVPESLPAMFAEVDMHVPLNWKFFEDSLEDVVFAAIQYADLGFDCLLYFGLCIDAHARMRNRNDADWVKMCNLCSLRVDRTAKSLQDAEARLRLVVAKVAPQAQVLCDMGGDGMLPGAPDDLVLVLGMDFDEMCAVSRTDGRGRGDLCASGIQTSRHVRLSSDAFHRQVGHPGRHWFYLLFAHRGTLKSRSRPNTGAR